MKVAPYVCSSMKVVCPDKKIGQILYCIKLMSISQIKSKIVFVKTMYALQVPLYRIKNTFPCKYFEMNHFKKGKTILIISSYSIIIHSKEVYVQYIYGKMCYLGMCV